MGRGGEFGPGTLFCGVMTSISLFISCFLLGFSFDTLDATTMGLMFDQNTRNLDCSKVYGADRGGGSRRWFTGLGVGFYSYRFPITARHMVFDIGGDSNIIDSKTSDGVSVTMALTLQYRLRRDAASLCNIVRTFGSDYHSFFANYVRSAARQALSQFEVYAMWQQRAQVGQAVRQLVEPEFSTRGAELIGLQLLSLDIPQTLQDEIENTTVQYQGIFQAQLQLQAQTVAAVTRQLQAETAAQVTLLNANAAAKAQILSAEASAQALNYTTLADGDGYTAFAGHFGMNTSDLLSLVWIDSILGTSSNHVLVSAGAPARTRGA